MPGPKAKDRIPVTCTICGRQWEKYRYTLATWNGRCRVCSLRKHGRERSTRVERACETCGATFTVKRLYVERGQGRFCSMPCRGKWTATLPIEQRSRWKGGPVTRQCEICGIAFTPRKVGRAAQIRFCSNACRGKWITRYRAGANSPAWQGGKSFEPYPPVWNRRLKAMIRERDSYRCGLCGMAGSTIIHHIDYDKSHCTPENLLVVCRSCHGRTNARRAFWQMLCTEVMTLRSWGLAPRAVNTL